MHRTIASLNGGADHNIVVLMAVPTDPGSSSGAAAALRPCTEVRVATLDGQTPARLGCLREAFAPLRNPPLGDRAGPYLLETAKTDLCCSLVSVSSVLK